MKQNIYCIVTNDDAQTVVASEVIGIHGVAEFMGYTEQYITKCIFYNRWSRFQKFRAFKVGETKPKPQNFRKRRKPRDLSGMTEEEKKQMYKEYQHEYQKKYRKDNAERLRQYHREWYIERVARDYK